MVMAAIAGPPAKVFATLKQFADSIDGIEKIGNIVTSVAGLILLGNGSSPVWVETLSETFSSYESFKNSFNWIRTGDGLFSNPYKFKDLTFLKFLMLTRRVCFFAVTFLSTIDYWNKLNKFVAPVTFPIKFSLLLATAVLSTIISSMELYENDIQAKKLKAKNIFILNVNDPSLDKTELSKKMKATAARIDGFETSVHKVLKKNEKALAKKSLEVSGLTSEEAEQVDLTKAAKEWLSEVKNLEVNAGDHKGLKKKLKMLKLLKNPTLKNLQDVRALLEMNNEKYSAFKVEQYKVREENLTIERKNGWRTIAKEIANMAVFSLLIANSAYLSWIPVDHTYAFNVGSKCVSLISGLIGAEKFFFENNHKVKSEPRPSEIALPLPVATVLPEAA